MMPGTDAASGLPVGFAQKVTKAQSVVTQVRCPIYRRACYAMRGTDIACKTPLAAIARAMRCALLTKREAVRDCMLCDAWF
eukprot:2858309-Rhodomonas_salina.4